MKSTDRPMTDSERTFLELVYTRFNTQVYNQVHRIVRIDEEAKDVVMRVFIKIKKLIEKDSTRFDDDKSSLPTWVHTVTTSVIRDYLRTEGKKQRRVQNVTDFADRDNEDKSYFFFEAQRSQNADTSLLNAELQTQITKAFRTLKPKYRKVAIMFYLREMEYTEIANVLDIPIGSVKGMLSRARAKLQTELESVYGFKGNVQSTEA